MWNWLAQLNPNTVIAVLVAVGTYVFHRLVPPATASEFDHVVSSLKAVLVTAVHAEAPNKTPQELGIILRGFAAVELAKLGYTAGQYPPLLQAALDAAVNEAIALYFTTAARAS